MLLGKENGADVEEEVERKPKTFKRRRNVTWGGRGKNTNTQTLIKTYVNTTEHEEKVITTPRQYIHNETTNRGV